MLAGKFKDHANYLNELKMARLNHLVGIKVFLFKERCHTKNTDKNKHARIFHVAVSFLDAHVGPFIRLNIFHDCQLDPVNDTE